ncbi:GNAT family N-acetyltransferase [Halobacillus sp. A5]|uniref:GNAT family N-acetyltransferase n=1 Tax=Halobacillus sp. A5 TaxID=2880263 RepID=UPI0020A6477E|nr:GNAT family N-acetyltransferase [Halobacillus sp. A5]MCP3029523.1 GNAT family N-acetyltransferase [Halobacillus sp. A5]
MEIIEFGITDVENHRDEMVEMLKRSFEKSFPTEKFDEDSFYRRIDNLKNYLTEKKAKVFSINYEGDLAGFIWFFERKDSYNTVIHINHFVVHEKFQRLGIGGSLLEKVETYANINDIKEIELYVTYDNEAAVNFYNKKSFEIERVIMKKRLMK